VAFGSEVFIVMKSYCDGSGTSDASPFVVLAGIAAEESLWSGFERGWGEVLKARDPIAPYLHMREVVPGKGPFKDENGWDDDKRVNLVQDCLAYSSPLDKREFCTFICTVDMRLYRRLKENGAKLPSVWRICDHFVPVGMFTWYLNEFQSRRLPELNFEFDQNERFIGPFQQLVRKNQRKTWSGLYNHWDVIKQISSANMRNTLPLQLADMIAWGYHRKMTPPREEAAWSRLTFFTEKVHPFFRKDVGKEELLAMVQYANIGTVVEDYFDSKSPTFPPPTDRLPPAGRVS
jgi:hypothetical protein